MNRIAAIWLYRLSLPLPIPYKVAQLVFRTFDPIVVKVQTTEDTVGWAETIVGPGYTDETDDGAWRFCRDVTEQLVGLPAADAKSWLESHLVQHSHAASVLISAIEMAQANPYLLRQTPARVPLLVPLQQTDALGLEAEVDRLIAQGYETFKVKIGFDVDADLRRVAWIQAATKGRARLRLDANQAYSVAQAKDFLARIDPAHIELLEQPCDKHDWAGNAEVALGSTLPIMLDESIYTLEDVRRATTLTGVKFVKVKINKLGGVQRLGDGLREIIDCGLRPVLGNGVATDISCWMEAAVASHVIDTTGEMNGWLKLQQSLFRNPLRVDRGFIDIPAGYWPDVDEAAIRTQAVDTFATASPLAA